MEMEVAGSFFPSLFFTPQPHPSLSIKRQLRELWQMSFFQGRAKQPSLFCQLPLQGSFWLHFDQYVCEYLIFTEDKKGKSSGIQQKVRMAIFLPGPASFYTWTSGAHYETNQRNALPGWRGRTSCSDSTIISMNTGIGAQTRQPQKQMGDTCFADSKHSLCQG